MNNADGTTYRFKKMLERLDIETTKVYQGRSRQTSIKDVHSLRHTFCYLHGMQGTALVVVQSMVGHMDKKMTESYMMHQTEELKRDAIDKLASKGFQPILLTPIEKIKKEIINKVEVSGSEQMLIQILDFIYNQNSLSQSANQKPDGIESSKRMKF